MYVQFEASKKSNILVQEIISDEFEGEKIRERGCMIVQAAPALMLQVNKVKNPLAAWTRV